jgi:hypothetical protein
MALLCRRFLVLVALMFWQGGFTFYAAVVVPVGQEVLGSHLAQGFITRQVTDYLNWAGAVCLLPLAWDAAVSNDPSGGRRWSRWLSWSGMAVLLAILAWLHGHLNGLLDLDAQTIMDRPTFRTNHRLYLWLSTIQWGFCLIYMGLTLLAWRTEDRMTGDEKKR